MVMISKRCRPHWPPRRRTERPSLIACRTTIAKGLARLQGQRGGHSARLHPADATAARRDLDWPHPPFEIPREVREAWRAAGRRSDAEHAAWRARRDALAPAERAEFERILAGELPAGWREVLANYKRAALERSEAPGGILISAEINDALTELLPERLVGCADLEAPTSHKRRLAAFTAQDRSGAYVHCGVREHLMGAMANGMAAHGGIVPLAVTYLAFADYERPAMRVGRADGPAGQVRVQPRLDRRRQERADASTGGDPGLAACDAQHAGAAPGRCHRSRRMLGDGTGTPQRPEHAGVRAPPGAASVRREPTGRDLSRRGAYVLAEAQGGARRVRRCWATGSEVAIALRARAIAGARRAHRGGVHAVLRAIRCAGRGVPRAGAGFLRRRARCGGGSGPLAGTDTSASAAASSA